MPMTSPDSSQILHTSALTGATPVPLRTAVNSPAGGFKNRVINGCMRIAQRPSAAILNGTGGPIQFGQVDRFYVYYASNQPGLNAFQANQTAGWRLLISGTPQVTNVWVGHRICADDSRDLAGNVVTLSALASNSLLTTMNWVLYYANVSDTFGPFQTPTKTPIASGTWAITSTENRYTAQIQVPAEAVTGLEIVFVTFAQTSGIWVLGEVQLEKGSLFTGFERRPVANEASLCRRFHQSGTLFPTITYAEVATAGQIWVPFTEQMHRTPTVTLTTGGTTLTNTGLQSVTNISKYGFNINVFSSLNAGLRGSTGSSYVADSELQ